MVNNVSVDFNTVLLKEFCTIYYLLRGLASAAEFFIYHLKETADGNASFIHQVTKSLHTASHEIDTI